LCKKVGSSVQEVTMGREIRRVPADWQHPKWINPHRGEEFKAQLEGPIEDAIEYFEGEMAEQKALWDKRACTHVDDDIYENSTFEEYFEENYGGPPDPDDYMPSWTEEEKTHIMMYQNTSEGTPLSPAFETPEELARWLADNNASAFGYEGATYEQWLGMCRSGWAPSAVMTNGVLESGVAALNSGDEG